MEELWEAGPSRSQACSSRAPATRGSVHLGLTYMPTAAQGAQHITLGRCTADPIGKGLAVLPPKFCHGVHNNNVPSRSGVQECQHATGSAGATFLCVRLRAQERLLVAASAAQLAKSNTTRRYTTC